MTISSSNAILALMSKDSLNTDNADRANTYRIVYQSTIICNNIQYYTKAYNNIQKNTMIFNDIQQYFCNTVQY